MADIVKGIKEFGLNVLRELLNGKQPETLSKKATLDDLTEEDLLKEKVRFDYKQRQMDTRFQKVEEEKRKLFEAGAKTKSKRERLVIAREFKEKDVEADNIQRMLDVISKQKRIINGLLLVKERTRVLSESGVSGILKDVNLEDLIVYIDKASVDGEFQESKINELLGVLEENYSNKPQSSKEDSDVLEIEKAMEQASEARDSPEVMEQLLDDLKIRNQQKETAEMNFEATEEDL
jgi:hypothetical protein